MDALGHRARPPDRQLDGRPRRARAGARDARAGPSLSLLAPALAFLRRRELVPLVRLLRPELAAIPHPLRAGAGPRAVLEHVRPARAARPRRRPTSPATSSAGPTARGRRGSPSTRPRATSTSTPRTASSGFWTRLRELDLPALFVWGDHDRLVPAGFSPPRRRGPARRPPGGPARLRPRAPGRAARRDQRADRRADRQRLGGASPRRRSPSPEPPDGRPRSA